MLISELDLSRLGFSTSTRKICILWWERRMNGNDSEVVGHEKKCWDLKSVNTMIYRLSFLVGKQSHIMLPKGFFFFGRGGEGLARVRERRMKWIRLEHACGQQNTFGSKKGQSYYLKRHYLYYPVYHILRIG